MAILGSIPKLDAVGDFSSRFEVGCHLLERGAHADAYLLFAALYREQEYHLPTLYNLALCHLSAGEWEPTLRLLERAYSMLKKNAVDTMPRDGTYKALIQRQASGRSYLFPLPELAPDLAPEYTRESILRLMVDACAACRMWEQVRALAGQLPAGRSYVNVERALDLANGNF